MKEIFDIKRFGALAKLHYRENLRFYLLALGLMIVVALLCLTEGNIVRRVYFPIDSSGITDSVSYGYQRTQMATFWCIWVALSVWFASRAFRDYQRKEKAGMTLLLPASNLEKFLLPFLNTTVVLGLVWLVVFYGVSWWVAYYNYGFYESVDPDNMAVLENAIKNNEISHPILGNVFDFSDMSRGDWMPAGMILAWVMTGIFFIQSLFMLGGLFFKRQAVLLTFLIQTVIFIIIVYVSGQALNYVVLDIQKFIRVWINTDQVKMSILQSDELDSLLFQICCDMYVVVLFPVCYFWAAFRKLQNKQG